jgi:hypothetical protein
MIIPRQSEKAAGAMVCNADAFFVGRVNFILNARSDPDYINHSRRRSTKDHHR